MRNFIFVTLAVAIAWPTSARADEAVHRQILQRLGALEQQNKRLADENAALRERVGRLEASRTVEVAGGERSHVETTGAVVATSAELPGAPAAHYPDRPSDRLRSFSWSGAYAGVHGGGAWGDLEMRETDLGFPFTFRDEYRSSGGLGGVQVGVNRQFGNLVLGGEIAISGANITGDKGDDCLIGPLAPIASRCETRVNWMASALAKVGYAHHRWLGYGMAGWSIAGADHTLTLDDPFGAISNRQNDVLDGFTYGLGGSHALTDSIVLGVEYLHADLKSRGQVLGSPILVGKAQRDVDLDIGRAHLNLRF